MQLGVKAVARGDRTAYLRWLAVTFVLGAVFVLAQARDWSRLHFSIGSHAYGSAFYLMTGFHGLHVIGGLLAMMVMGGPGSVAPLRRRRPALGGDAVLLLAFRRRRVDRTMGDDLLHPLTPPAVTGSRLVVLAGLAGFARLVLAFAGGRHASTAPEAPRG